MQKSNDHFISSFDPATLIAGIGGIGDALNTGLGKIGMGKELRNQQLVTAMNLAGGLQQSQADAQKAKAKQKTILIIGSIVAVGIVLTLILVFANKKK